MSIYTSLFLEYPVAYTIAIIVFLILLILGIIWAFSAFDTDSKGRKVYKNKVIACVALFVIGFWFVVLTCQAFCIPPSDLYKPVTSSITEITPYQNYYKLKLHNGDNITVDYDDIDFSKPEDNINRGSYSYLKPKKGVTHKQLKTWNNNSLANWNYDSLVKFKECHIHLTKQAESQLHYGKTLKLNNN